MQPQNPVCSRNNTTGGGGMINFKFLKITKNTIRVSGNKATNSQT